MAEIFVSMILKQHSRICNTEICIVTISYIFHPHKNIHIFLSHKKVLVDDMIKDPRNRKSSKCILFDILITIKTLQKSVKNDRISNVNAYTRYIFVREINNGSKLN